MIILGLKLSIYIYPYCSTVFSIDRENPDPILLLTLILNLILTLKFMCGAVQVDILLK